MPHIQVLTPMAFAANNSFLRSSKASFDFEGHSTGLSTILLRHLDSNAHQVVDEADKGAIMINSRGLSFILSEGALLIH